MKDKDPDIRDLATSTPIQLELFQAENLLRSNREIYSRSIEFYDLLPKYYMGRQEHLRHSIAEQKRETLPILNREFVYAGLRYKIQVRPARVDVKIKSKNGERQEINREIYPGPREELVEEVLRKIGLEQHNACYVNFPANKSSAAIVFTLNGLYQELSATQHTYSKDEIKEALMVCRHCEIVITCLDDPNQPSSSAPIFLYAHLSANGSNTAPNYVILHPLVTASIDQKTWRISNYEQLMAHRRPLTRYLHRRLNHRYTNASPDQPYTILLSTILRDSGAPGRKRFRKNREEVEISLTELADARIIKKNWREESVEILEKTSRRPKVVDVKYNLFAHPDFAAFMKKSHIVKNLITSEGKRQ